MIPKLAHFYWSGSEMSWLRQQGLDSFARHNPEWTVVVHGGANHLGGLRDIVLDSDQTRYEVLASSGGFYFDTDIIFTAPIPEEWLRRDNAIVARDGTAQGVAALGSKPGSRFFASIVDDCKARRASKTLLAYQSLGIKLFFERDVRRMAAAYGETLFEIPIETLFPCPWSGVEKLWSDLTWNVPSNSVGVHWFGGDEMSREFEPQINPDTLGDFPCLITQILSKVPSELRVVSGS